MRLDDLYLIDIIEARESIARMVGETKDQDFLADENIDRIRTNVCRNGAHKKFENDAHVLGGVLHD